ncbi:hypothetical protein [Kitasatospora sp. NPDC004289]
MPCFHRAVLLRAAVAALVLGVAMGAEATVGPAMARRGVERAEHEAYRCGQLASADSAARAGRSQPEGRPPLGSAAERLRCRQLR